MNTCPICRLPLMRPARPAGDGLEIVCANCSPFTITGSALKLLERGFAPMERARISHGLFGARNRQVTSHRLEDLSATMRLPGATELIDNLLLYLAEETGSPGEAFTIESVSWAARLGASSPRGVTWAAEQCIALKYIEGTVLHPLDGSFQLLEATLTPPGWERVDELRRQAKDSRKAFMAMQFGDAAVDAVFRDYWVPSVEQTGFRLRRLDDEPAAGLIDDRLRTEVRTSRFLLADLTHRNAGAYWEAGFAEGLGRPVIYLCRRDVFDNPATRPHFDTNHHLTVVWDPTDLSSSSAQLKSVIRVTLPNDAIQEDP